MWATPTGNAAQYNVSLGGTGYTPGNYIVFSNVAPFDVVGGFGTITLSGEGAFRNFSNGIQLVSVPEPASVALFGLERSACASSLAVAAAPSFIRVAS